METSIPYGIEDVNPMWNDKAQQIAWMASNLGRARDRYRLLIDQLIEEDAVERKVARPGPPARGWQKRVGQVLGVKQSHLSKIHSQEQQPNIDLIESAIRGCNISPLFFFAPYQTDPHYRQFRGPIRIDVDMGYPALRRFLDSAGQIGLTPTDQERHVLERQEWDAEPTEATYTLFLQALRTLKSVTVTQVRRKPSEPPEVKPFPKRERRTTQPGGN